MVRSTTAPRRESGPDDGGSLFGTRPASAALRAAADLGTAMHRYLAAVDLDRDAVDDILCDAVATDREMRAELREVAARFHTSDLRERLRRARIVRREVPVAFARADGTPFRGTLDVLIRDDHGTTIVDYKTDRVLDGAFAAAARRYRTQLEGYGEAVRRALGLDSPPRLCVHFVRHDRTETP
jgi:ATP-dependent exoDNAse (exonuclease V) beta subunit